MVRTSAREPVRGCPRDASLDAWLSYLLLIATPDLTLSFADFLVSTLSQP